VEGGRENWKNGHHIVLKACFEDDCSSAGEEESCREKEYVSAEEIEDEFCGEEEHTDSKEVEDKEHTEDEEVHDKN
jgi:hypothetical protein